MQNNGNGMGEVQRWITLLAVQGYNPLAETQLVVGESPVFPAEHQRRGRITGQQPAQPVLRRLQRDRAVVQAPAGGDHPSSVADGGFKVLVKAGVPQQGCGMNRHPNGVFSQHIAARINKSQIVHAEIGAEPGHTPEVQRTCGLNQDNGNVQVSSWRWLSRSAIASGAI